MCVWGGGGDLGEGRVGVGGGGASIQSKAIRDESWLVTTRFVFRAHHGFSSSQMQGFGLGNIVDVDVNEKRCFQF